MKDIIYFEVNNWFVGRDYPNTKQFIEWMGDDLCIAFRNEEWVKANKLYVVYCRLDMSQNFCVTATRKWVEENCPELLTDYKQFLRYPDEEGDVYGEFGEFDYRFLPYSEENFIIEEVKDPYFDDDEE